jgi:hypothetical protein
VTAKTSADHFPALSNSRRHIEILGAQTVEDPKIRFEFLLRLPEYGSRGYGDIHIPEIQGTLSDHVHIGLNGM